LKKIVVDYGPSPYYVGFPRDVRLTLTCFYFPSFVIKEVYAGQKGNESLTVVPESPGQQLECSRKAAMGERKIDDPGYFKGAVGDFVLFSGPGGHNGGIPFVVFNSKTWKVHFEDSAYSSSIENRVVEESPFNRMRVRKGEGGQVILTYLRVEESGCDLNTEAARCWSAVREKLGIVGHERAPRCYGYDGIKEWYTSAIAYPVEVALLPKPAMKNIPGPVKCRPVS
jgi:hypothetical protein